MSMSLTNAQHFRWLVSGHLRGPKGAAYRTAWNRLHRARMCEVKRDFRARHGKTLYKEVHKRSVLKYGVSELTRRNRKSAINALRTGMHWHPTEDALLRDGKLTQSQLAAALGRTLRAIQLRKRRLRANTTQASSMGGAEG